MAATLIPILNCIQVEPGPSSYIAVWGYTYTRILPLTLAIGSGNSFSPAPSNRGQPIIFSPGTHNDVFSVAFTTTLAWTLQAPLQPSPNTVIATSASTVCTFCPPGQSKDCLGVCGGTAVLDCAGVCNGTSVKDCAGVCNGTSVKDCNGVCNGTAKFDCNGICGGSAVPDCVGICNGTAVKDCAGTCAGLAVKDCAG